MDALSRLAAAVSQRVTFPESKVSRDLLEEGQSPHLRRFIPEKT